MKTDKLFTKVLLDKPWRIRFSKRCFYRIQMLDRPLNITEIGTTDRSFAALCQWLWACLDEENPFDTPEKIAEVIDLDRLPEIKKTLYDCVNLDEPKNQKNEISSTTSPSPASSSD